MDLLNLAHRVKKGVKLLDRKVPNWRSILKNHESQFDFADGECCVLGTLEHYSGRMRVLKKRVHITDSENAFGKAAETLRISGDTADYGFDGQPAHGDFDLSYQTQVKMLSDLWKAEIGIGL
jgi:hypothetical protein